jgi:hypothetical protein
VAGFVLALGHRPHLRPGDTIDLHADPNGSRGLGRPESARALDEIREVAAELGVRTEESA